MDLVVQAPTYRVVGYWLPYIFYQRLADSSSAFRLPKAFSMACWTPSGKSDNFIWCSSCCIYSVVYSHFRHSHTHQTLTTIKTWGFTGFASLGSNTVTPGRCGFPLWFYSMNPITSSFAFSNISCGNFSINSKFLALISNTRAWSHRITPTVFVLSSSGIWNGKDLSV